MPSSHITQPDTESSDEVFRDPHGGSDEWVEVTEAQGGNAQVITLWKRRQTSDGDQARPVWRAIRPKGTRGPLLLVA